MFDSDGIPEYLSVVAGSTESVALFRFEMLFAKLEHPSQ